MKLRALAAATVVVAGASIHAAPAKPLAGWYPCSANSFVSMFPVEASMSAQLPPPPAQCATFKAPLCYDGVCDDSTKQEIDIFVKRLNATADDRPNVILMQGGPGAASDSMESMMIALHRLLDGTMNVYTMDHRGTGRSNKLECVAAQAMMSGSPGGPSVEPQEVASCADDLEKRYGQKLAAFSITSAASDLQYFISNYLPNSKTFVYGVSYGTALVERLMHLNTTEIAGYVLDGVSTTSGSDVKNFEYFSTWDVDYNAVGEFFLSYCEKNMDECGKYFKGTTLTKAIQKLIAEVDQSSFVCNAFLQASMNANSTSTTSTLSSQLRSRFGRLLADADTRNLIPVLTYRITRCNSDDQAVLDHYFNPPGTGSGLGGGMAAMEAFSSDLTYKIIMFSEIWENPAPSFNTMKDRFLNTTMSTGMQEMVASYCAFTKDTSEACADFQNYTTYNASPILYARDKYWNVAASLPTNVSVLIMSGKMDPQTPHKFAEYFHDALKTDNKALVAFETATHGTATSTPMSSDPDGDMCGMLILASYLSNGGDLKATNTSCLALMPPLNFNLDAVATTLNATSAYDGKLNASIGGGTVAGSQSDTKATPPTSKSFKGGFITFAILFGLAAVAVIVLFVKWRNARSGQLPTYARDRT